MSRPDCELSAGRVAVRFAHRGDRWGHAILIDGQMVLTSAEGTPEEAWPASPPLQELHEQALADGRRAIFGVGMAGRSHWSLSVTADGDRLVFEAACRAFGERGPLGSGYQIAPRHAPPALSVSPGTRITRGDDRLRIAPDDAATPTWSWSVQ